MTQSAEDGGVVWPAAIRRSARGVRRIREVYAGLAGQWGSGRAETICHGDDKFL